MQDCRGQLIFRAFHECGPFITLSILREKPIVHVLSFYSNTQQQFRTYTVHSFETNFKCSASMLCNYSLVLVSMYINANCQGFSIYAQDSYN